MKILRITALFLFGAAPLVLAQDSPWGTTAPDLRVAITRVDPAMAVDPGRMNVFGTNLQLVSKVTLGNREYPVVFNDGLQLAIRPGPQAPGISSLALWQGEHKVTTDVVLLPALSAEFKTFRVRLSLQAGESGWYVVSYSFRPAPEPITFPGIYFQGYLDLNLPQSGALYSGTVEAGGTMVFPWMRLPTMISGGAFQPMYVQALCMSQGQTCFSNAMALTPFL